jgi:hypothetical protein
MRVSPIYLFLVIALVAAVAAFGAKRMGRSRRRSALFTRPGASLASPLAIRSFDEMDAHLAEWLCVCGARPRVAGEGSREIDARRFRVARLRCDACEEDWFVYFDTTDLLQ